MHPPKVLAAVGPRIRVLVTDDHLIVRLGLSSLIDGEDDMQVVGQAANGHEALDRFRTLRPDVVLLDLRMPGHDGFSAIEAIRAEDPQARILVVTVERSQASVYRALRSGARGYVAKDAGATELLGAIRTVAAGGSWLAPDVAAQMAAHMRRPALSAREIEILDGVAQGLSNKRIAHQLSVSESTVRCHVASIMEKLGADNRAHAVRLGLERNILAS